MKSSMKSSWHRGALFGVVTMALPCALFSLGGCGKDRPPTVHTPDPVVPATPAPAASAAPAPAASDGAAQCVASDAPKPTLTGDITPDAALQAMTLAADWQLANPAKWATNLWHYAAFWVGMTKFAPLVESPKYFDAIRKDGEENQWQPAARPGHSDDQSIISSYFYVYSIERDKKTIEPSLSRFDEMTKKTFDAPLTWDEVPETPGKTASGDPAIHTLEWAWCDALFMAPPAMALTTANTGDTKYLKLADKLWWKTTDYLYDNEEHLYFRDSRFFEQREPNGKKVFWSRGNGWVLAGTARMLQNMPEQLPERERYVTLFREMASKLAELQGDDGFWRASLLDPDSVPRPESSGTAFFTYGLAWGINQGILDRASFEPVVNKGWSALTSAVLPNGKLGWVQEVGYKPGDTCWDRTEVYGVGAFLLAGSEIYRTALLGDSPRLTRLLKNPKAKALFDEVIAIPLNAEEVKAISSGSKLVAVDGRSGEFLPSQERSPAGPLLVHIGNLAPSEKRRVHIYRLASPTKLPPFRPNPFGTKAPPKGPGAVGVEVIGG